MTIYKFQCNRCFIVSGYVDTDPAGAPNCCGGERMDAIRMESTIEPYGFGMIVRLPANRYRSEHLCVLTSEGTKVAGNNNVWRYYAMTLDEPHMNFKIYSDDFQPTTPEFCLLPIYVPHGSDPHPRFTPTLLEEIAYTLTDRGPL